MEEKDSVQRKKKSVFLFAVGVFIIVAILGISYAVLMLTLTGNKKYGIQVGALQLNLDESKTSTDIFIENGIPMTDIDGMKNDPYNFSLQNGSNDDIDYTIYLVEEEFENKTPSHAIRYFYSRDIDQVEVVRNMEDQKTEDGRFFLETGIIPANTTYQYTFKMWVNYNAGTEINHTKYSVHLEVEAVQNLTKKVTDKAFASENLGESCKTYDDGTDTFLVGQCNQNHVWYSGKLWRVVLKNNKTGAVKLVTDNAITAIPYNEEDNAIFENSYID